ncbi:hypothetical protein PF006_g29554 [Phytophthora fragariae]|uniref:Uncharacterized protein n=1 Tax=Phytophthora fragariae TaxID=53985 RepID=A0A6A3DLR5_9STRA|nr:hypothetical protein PF009_g30381 [Phytophthora fragariae]KAE9069535.1 hypothetical protein PF006_g29554 [Phytophthora fragariae]KAE9279048.1 hypothetical protein PF008_g28469 [Phytophthora fragariae]
MPSGDVSKSRNSPRLIERLDTVDSSSSDSPEPNDSPPVDPATAASPRACMPSPSPSSYELSSGSTSKQKSGWSSSASSSISTTLALASTASLTSFAFLM